SSRSSQNTPAGTPGRGGLVSVANRRSRWIAVFAIAGVACAKEKRVDPTEAAFADFSKRVDDYVAFRKHLADSIGPLDPTPSQTEIASRARTLANAIITARPSAKQGDIFTTEVAAIMATLIKQEYSRRPAPVVETRGDQQEELPDFVPKVNELYPTTYPLAT